MKTDRTVKKRIWITWEYQRRSVELSKHFGCRLYIFEHQGLMRYFKCIRDTVLALSRERPAVLYVQNPSMILAALACLYQSLFGTPVVVDRHTTFLLSRKYRNTPRIILYKLLNLYTVRCAELTIVTNTFLAELVESMGGRSFVLPDKLPELIFTQKIALEGRSNLLMISSFGNDEPVEQVINAMDKLQVEGVSIYITGNYRKKFSDSDIELWPANVHCTGFLPEQDFLNYLYSVDAVIVLTTSDYCMLCGCYEAVSSKKPLITSDKDVLSDYFRGAVFVDNSESGIYNAIIEVLGNLVNYKDKIVLAHANITSIWNAQAKKLEYRLKAIELQRT